MLVIWEGLAPGRPTLFYIDDQRTGYELFGLLVGGLLSLIYVLSAVAARFPVSSNRSADTTISRLPSRTTRAVAAIFPLPKRPKYFIARFSVCVRSLGSNNGKIAKAVAESISAAITPPCTTPLFCLKSSLI